MIRYSPSPHAIIGRTLLASLGGYIMALSFCAGAAVLFSIVFGMPRAEAIVLSAMLGFLVWMLAALIAYAAATGWRAAAWVLGSSALFALLAWALGPLSAPGAV